MLRNKMTASTTALSAAPTLHASRLIEGGMKALILAAILSVVYKDVDKSVTVDLDAEESTNLAALVHLFLSTSRLPAPPEKITKIVYEALGPLGSCEMTVYCGEVKLSFQAKLADTAVLDFDTLFTQIGDNFYATLEASERPRRPSQEETLAALPGCKAYVVLNYYTA